MKIERFFHVRTGATRGGATVRVVGDTDTVGTVEVQTVFCSKKDPYCKKVGRELSTAEPIKVVPLRYLAAELGRVHEEVYKRNKVSNWPVYSLVPDYTFAIKYFLPKE